MKTPLSSRLKRGFTLIELLTVIAIIGILAAIIIPAVGGVITNANRTAAQSSLKGIAVGYKNFSIGGSRSRTITSGPWAAGSTTATTSADWAQVLADFADVNEAPVYFVDSAQDVAGIATIPQVILAGDPLETTAAWDSAISAISYQMALNIPPNGGNTNPIIWTKGLQTDGTWSSNLDDSPWGDAGGHIGFADGSVRWFDDTVNQLIDPDDGTPISNIQDAVGGSDNVTTLP